MPTGTVNEQSNISGTDAKLSVVDLRLKRKTGAICGVGRGGMWRWVRGPALIGEISR